MLNETLMEEHMLLPVSVIGDIKIELIGIEGFIFTKGGKETDIIPTEDIYLLMKGLKRILKRRKKNHSDSYDTSCDFEEYFSRINVEKDVVSLQYWEKSYGKEMIFKTILSFSIEYAEDIADTIIEMVEEMKEEDF